MPRKANSNSNAGEKKPEEKKTQDFGALGEFEEAATSTSAAPEGYEVAAEDVTAVGYDGSETPLVDVEPALKGEAVTVPSEAIIPADEAPVVSEKTEKKTYSEAVSYTHLRAHET